MRGSGTGADLEREARGAEERRVSGVEVRGFRFRSGPVWAEDGMKLKVDVPVVFKGEDACPGVQKGNLFDLI